ncbi:MAG TPA: aspartate dehydrogenase domain-containing protein, partial [Burkholderiaceae bacterium]|nr:aspartate dehydrogenase domain-containing protein [Burkholderiaceae bacterium]
MPAAHRFGLIGCGRIGAAVVEAWQQGLAPGWQLQGVLARSPRRIDGVATFTDATAFLALDVDLIVEVAGPQALAQLGPQALLRADTWTVSATALADPAVFEALWAAGAAGGHRLRVLAGAIAGLDGVAAASVDPDARLQLSIDLPPVARPSGVAPEGRQVVFTGSVRQAAARFPTKVNVAAAAALAGPGLD